MPGINAFRAIYSYGIIHHAWHYTEFAKYREGGKFVIFLTRSKAFTLIKEGMGLCP